MKPKALEQMWAHPGADVFCLTCTVLKSQCFKSQNVHVKMLNFWLLLTKCDLPIIGLHAH